jgi:hypothetical protein
MTNTQFTVLVVAALAMAVVAAFIGTWLYLRDRDDADDYYHYDDYFSDIQDAIKDEDEGQMEGQQKLWETGQMPALTEEHVGPPAVDWWDMPKDASVELAEAVPQLEPGETATPAPEAVSVSAEAMEDDIDSTFIRDFKADLDAWVAEQEAIRQAWRKENGLDA